MIKKILISQPKPASDKSPYYDIAQEYGTEMVFRPFFKVEGISSKEFRQQKISLLDHTAVVFTSRHAIDNYFKLAKELRITIPEDMKYFCLIETVALYIQKYVQYRKRKVFFGTNGKIDGLIPLMLKHKNEKYLVPLSSVHNDDIKNMMVFFSPTGVKALKKNFPDFEQGDIKIAAFGPATAKEVEAQGLHIDLVAPSKEYPSMTAALKAYLEAQK